MTGSSWGRAASPRPRWRPAGREIQMIYPTHSTVRALATFEHRAGALAAVVRGRTVIWSPPMTPWPGRGSGRRRRFRTCDCAAP